MYNADRYMVVLQLKNTPAFILSFQYMVFLGFVILTSYAFCSLVGLFDSGISKLLYCLGFLLGARESESGINLNPLEGCVIGLDLYIFFFF